MVILAFACFLLFLLSHFISVLHFQKVSKTTTLTSSSVLKLFQKYHVYKSKSFKTWSLRANRNNLSASFSSQFYLCIRCPALQSLLFMTGIVFMSIVLYNVTAFKTQATETDKKTQSWNTYVNFGLLFIQLVGDAVDLIEEWNSTVLILYSRMQNFWPVYIGELLSNWYRIKSLLENLTPYCVCFFVYILSFHVMQI